MEIGIGWNDYSGFARFRNTWSRLNRFVKNMIFPVIMLITPETSDERIRLIDEYCGGFIYYGLFGFDAPE